MSKVTRVSITKKDGVYIVTCPAGSMATTNKAEAERTLRVWQAVEREIEKGRR